METKKKDVTLYGLMYDPWPTSKKQTDLPGPFFDLTVVALGIVGAVGYFVLNAYEVAKGKCFVSFPFLNMEAKKKKDSEPQKAAESERREGAQGF